MAATRVSELYRTAFITGASTGLGLAFAKMLLEDGVRVWGTSRERSRLDSIEQKFPSLFTPVALDLRDGAAAEATLRTLDDGTKFDLVINNAGYSVFGSFTATDFTHWQAQMDAMLVNTARLSHVALRGMLERNHGALVNISSLAAEFPLPYQSAYNVTKAGLTALSESLMIEMAGTGIVVLDVRPGDYRTDFEGSVRRPSNETAPRVGRAWAAFSAMMQTGPLPAHAAAALRRALLKRKSGTVRIGRFFQAVLGPLLARFGSLPLRRRIQARYYDVS